MKKIYIKVENEEEYKSLIRYKIMICTMKNEKGCWEWQRSKHKQGYGNLSYKKKNHLAHRVAWMVFKSDILDEKEVCHICDNPCCCNPEHLFLGSQLDNMRDAKRKGKYKNRNISKTRRIKLNWEQVQEIRKMNSEGISRKELQKRFQVSQTCIAKILTGTSWKINWTQEL